MDQLVEHSWSHFCYSPFSLVDQLADHIWSHFCYSPLITRGSAGRLLLVTLRLRSTHHPWVSWQAQLVTLLLLSTHNLLISWQSTSGHTSVTLHSSPVDQLADYSWSNFGNSSLITRDQLAEYSWSNFGYCPLIIHGSAGRAQLVALRLLYTHHPWVSWQSTTGHTSITRHS